MTNKNNYLLGTRFKLRPRINTGFWPHVLHTTFNLVIQGKEMHLFVFFEFKFICKRKIITSDDVCHTQR